MNYLSRVSLYRYGVRVCEQIFLPFLISSFEPVSNLGDNTLAMPLVDSLVTEKEIKKTLDNYQVVDYLLKYGLAVILVMIAYGISKLFGSILDAPAGVISSLILVCDLAFLVFWIGVYMRIKSRRQEWRKIMNREILIENIEHYARATSSAIIAQILVDIENLKETQKVESEKARKYSLLKMESMQAFEEMMDLRDSKNRMKSMIVGVVTFALGYATEKTLSNYRKEP
jgi:predicted ABC-type exoprotein transport system permease subunit